MIIKGRFAPTIEPKHRIGLRILCIGALFTLCHEFIDSIVLEQDLLQSFIGYSFVGQETFILHPRGLLLGVPEEPVVLLLQFINVKFLRIKHPVKAIDLVLSIVDQLVVLFDELEHGSRGVLHVVIGVACDLMLAISGLKMPVSHLHHSFHCACLDLS